MGYDLVGSSSSATHGATNFGKEKKPQIEEQRGKRACALTARGSVSQAVQGLVGGAAAGTAEHRTRWITALIPRSSGRGTHLTNAD